MLPLFADAPHPDHADEFALFGHFVGAWDMDVEFFDDSGKSVHRGPGEWTFAWILDGRAMQDVFTYTYNGQRGSGTSIRTYHPEAKRWRVVWHGTVSGVMLVFYGGRDGERIRLEGVEPDGTKNRWMFADIRRDSFTWTGEVWTEQGKLASSTTHARHSPFNCLVKARSSAGLPCYKRSARPCSRYSRRRQPAI